MAIHRITMFAMAATLTSVVVAPTAHGEPSSFQFLSPSGNVGCQLGTGPHGQAYAWCKANEHDWVASGSDDCPVANVPGAIGEPGGEDLQLVENGAPCFGFVMSQLFFSGQYAPPTVGLGDSRSMGDITCAVQVSEVTCTDRPTGRFFKVSRDSYELG